MIIEKEEKRIRINLSRLFAFAILTFCVACENLHFHTFHKLHGDWNATDTLNFMYVNDVGEDSIMLDVELRCTSSFPFRELWLYLECISDEEYIISVDTVCCDIFDSLGRQNGACAGTLYQTSFPVALCKTLPRDTVYIKIAHLMNGSLSGINDVGVKIYGSAQRQFLGN